MRKWPCQLSPLNGRAALARTVRSSINNKTILLRSCQFLFQVLDLFFKCVSFLGCILQPGFLVADPLCEFSGELLNICQFSLPSFLRLQELARKKTADRYQTLQMLRLPLSKAQGCKVFKKINLNPVMLGSLDSSH